MSFESIVTYANDLIWSDVLIYLLVAVGIYFSIRMRFFQIRMVKRMVGLMLNGRHSAAGISSFQALAVSLSGRVGTGNIAGVATAIFVGGPERIQFFQIRILCERHRASQGTPSSGHMT